MITTLQFDIQTAEQEQKLQMVLDYVSAIGLPFQKKDSDDANADWSGDWSTYEMAMPVLARDWECPEAWAELSKTPIL